MRTKKPDSPSLELEGHYAKDHVHQRHTDAEVVEGEAGKHSSKASWAWLA